MQTTREGFFSLENAVAGAFLTNTSTKKGNEKNPIPDQIGMKIKYGNIAFFISKAMKMAFVRMASSAILTSFSSSARTAEVVSKLMHDVETNPGPNCSGVSCFFKSTSYLLIIRVTALVQGNLVPSLEFSMMPTPVWILLRGFFLDQPTPLAVLNATPPPLQLQSKRSLIESILMSVARG